MEFLQLKYFCDAAEMQNISRAAKLNKVPASGVSSSIKRLEQELDTTLFLRYANKVKLTEQGQFFYEEAVRLLEELESVKNRVRQIEEIGRKITVCVMACQDLVERSVLAFQKQNPKVGFELYPNVKKSGNVDFYISDELFYVRGCRKEILLEENFVLALSPDHPLAVVQNVDLQALKKERFVCTNAGTNIHHRVSAICYDHGFVPDVAVTVLSPADAVKYIQQGCVIGIFPETELPPAEGMVMKKLDGYRRTVCVFYEEARLRAKVNQLFLETLLETGKTARPRNPD